VEVRLASAAAMLERRYATEDQAVMSLRRTLSKSTPSTGNQEFHACPVCDCFGVATGQYTIEWVPAGSDKGPVPNIDGDVWFSAQAFRCQVYGLRLDSDAEIDAAGFDSAWEIEGGVWRDYEPEQYDDADGACERRREENCDW
jgi:hypothetical protein